MIDIQEARLKTAEEEAKRFLQRIKELRDIEKKWDGFHPRQMGAVKRASMDLTRALADLRRSPYQDMT
jgi:hypothetical protein